MGMLPNQQCSSIAGPAGATVDVQPGQEKRSPHQMNQVRIIVPRATRSFHTTRRVFQEVSPAKTGGIVGRVTRTFQSH